MWIVKERETDLEKVRNRVPCSYIILRLLPKWIIMHNDHHSLRFQQKGLYELRTPIYKFICRLI